MKCLKLYTSLMLPWAAAVLLAWSCEHKPAVDIEGAYAEWLAVPAEPQDPRTQKLQSLLSSIPADHPQSARAQAMLQGLRHYAQSRVRRPLASAAPAPSSMETEALQTIRAQCAALAPNLPPPSSPDRAAAVAALSHCHRELEKAKVQSMHRLGGESKAAH